MPMATPLLLYSSWARNKGKHGERILSAASRRSRVTSVMTTPRRRPFTAAAPTIWLASAPPPPVSTPVIHPDRSVVVLPSPAPYIVPSSALTPPSISPDLQTSTPEIDDLCIRTRSGPLSHVLLTRSLSRFRPLNKLLLLSSRLFREDRPRFRQDLIDHVLKVVQGGGDDARASAAAQKFVLKSLLKEKRVLSDLLSSLDLSLFVITVDDYSVSLSRFCLKDKIDGVDCSEISLHRLGLELGRLLRGSHLVKSEVEQSGPYPHRVFLSVTTAQSSNEDDEEEEEEEEERNDRLHIMYLANTSYFFCDRPDPDPSVCSALSRCLQSSGYEESPQEPEIKMEVMDIEEEEEEEVLREVNGDLYQVEMQNHRLPGSSSTSSSSASPSSISSRSRFAEFEMRTKRKPGRKRPKKPRVPCSVVECGKDFADRWCMAQHVKSVHLGIKDQKCPYCDYTCSQHIRLHIKTAHLDIRDHACPDCEYRSARQAGVLAHYKSVHLRLKDHECPYCNYSTSSQSSLPAHIDNKHPEVRMSYQYRCHFCDFRALEQRHLKAHMSVVHSTREFMEMRRETTVKKVNSDLCRVEIQNHRLPGTSSTSSSSASSISLKSRWTEFEMRTRRKPGKKRPQKPRVPCSEECGKDFADRWCMAMHVKSVHLGIKDQKCPHCDYTCSQHIRLHIKTAHLDIRDHACPECEYRASRRTGVLAHYKAVHLRLKDHECPYCNYSTSTLSSLPTHIDIKHPEVRMSYQFRCHYCDFRALEHGHLKAHLTVVHSTREYMEMRRESTVKKRKGRTMKNKKQVGEVKV